MTDKREDVARIIDPAAFSSAWQKQYEQSDASMRLFRDNALQKADAILALLSAPQDRDVGGDWRFTPMEVEMLLHLYAIAEPLPRMFATVREAALQSFIERGFVRPSKSSGSGYRTTKLGERVVNAICNPSTPPSVAVIPDGLAKLLEDVAPTIHALRHYTTNDLKPGEMPGNILLLSDAVAVIALYDALSASPSPALNRTTGESLEAEEKEMFRLADRLGYVCTPEPHPDSPHVQEQEETRIAIKDEARREMATIAANCEIKFSPARSGQLADQIELARGGIAKAILNTIGQP